MLRLPVFGLFCCAIVGFAIACGDDATETVDDATEQPEATVAGATDTPSPSLSPTPEPTAEPTPVPTPEPTSQPTPKPTPQPTQAPIVTQAPVVTQPPVQNCDPSYPSVCIPRYPPDLDCGEITFRRFTVLPPDPHGFDGDNDGIGCESG